ncbi:MAG TPA: hypothetical protein VHL58_02015 [Thermoanaerobaculia bacterium]|nr:hypothetical protein [Thermoanaerobaculia bacterium]
MISLLLFLSLLPAVRSIPLHPTVGDSVVVELPIAAGTVVSVDPSTDFELLAISGNRVTIRSFKPGPVSLSARFSRPGQVPVTETISVPIESVLKKGDQFQPAPLKPPRMIAPLSRPRQILAAAALITVLSWGLLFFAARRSRSIPVEIDEPSLPADAEMIRALDRIARGERSDSRWVELAEAVRRYLARTDASLGTELTTSELLARLSSYAPAPETSLVQTILNEGDWVKFSGKSRRRDDHQVIASSARSLVRATPAEEVAA